MIEVNYKGECYSTSRSLYKILNKEQRDLPYNPAILFDPIYDRGVYK